VRTPVYPGSRQRWISEACVDARRTAGRRTSGGESTAS